LTLKNKFAIILLVADLESDKKY